MEVKKSLRCPKCKQSDVIPIYYGYPGERTIKRAKLGEIILGGSSISKNSPEWHCKNCENKWGVYKQFF